MWIPVIEIIVGFIDILTNQKWFSKTPIPITFLNGLWHGASIIFLVFGTK